MKNALLYDGLEYWRKETPDKLCLYQDDGESLTYAEMGAWTDGVAAALQDVGVVPGDLVAVSGQNCMQWVPSAWGVLKSGATIVPYNERFTANEMGYLLETTEPKAIIADAPRAGILRAAGAKVPILIMDEIGQHRPGRPGWTPPRISSDSIGVIIFTSGSTGRPKGVMFSHGEHLAKLYELQLQDQTFCPDMRHLMTVGFQSGVGSQFAYPLTHLCGGTLYFLRKYDPDLTLKMLVEHKITFLPTFPLLFEQVSNAAGFEDAKLHIRTGHTGGQRVPPHVLKRWFDKGVYLRQMYGQTEVCGYACIASNREVEHYKHTCGHDMIHTKIRVVKPDGTPCAPNEVGDVRVKGPGQMIGYWKNPEATAQTIVDGWIHTGDLGLLDEDGDFQFVDRAKDMIITGGFNVSPSEVERIIGEFPGVVESVVIPTADAKFGETPAAIVYCEGGVIDEDALFAHCKARLAGFKLPRYVIAVSEPIPRLSTGKMNKMKMRADYADANTRYRKLG